MVPFHHQRIFFVKEQNIILQSLKKISPSFYTFYTMFSFFLLLFFSLGKRHKMRELIGSALGWAGRRRQSSIHAKLYANGSLMSSSPWERSSFFSSVLARELRLLWAPMYRVAYTGLVKLVGCRAKKITR